MWTIHQNVAIDKPCVHNKGVVYIEVHLTYSSAIFRLDILTYIISVKICESSNLNWSSKFIGIIWIINASDITYLKVGIKVTLLSDFKLFLNKNIDLKSNDQIVTNIQATNLCSQVPIYDHVINNI